MAELLTDVLTPDFYSYRWDALASVEVDGRFVTLRWPDGIEFRAFDLWLRENAMGEGGINIATREGTCDPALFDDALTLTDVGLTADAALQVTFEPEGRTAIYHPGWLRHVADKQHRPDSWLPGPRRWTTGDLAEPPTHEGSRVLSDDDVLRAWVDDLLRYGIARLRNLPLDPDFGLALGDRVGALRDTNFGVIWDVKVDVDPNSTANTSLRLGPHTDLPTRETPPGFQFLHCIANTTQGGWSTMADGAAVADYIAQHHPDDYEALTTLRWVFFNRGQGIDHRWSGPIIDLGVEGSPLTFRAFYPLKAFPDMAEADMPRAYAAAKRFHQVAADERFQMRYPFEPGDMVGFDNRRILHGRDSYDATAGHRHLRGIYIDQDEVRSCARVLNRQLAAREAGEKNG